MFLETYKVTLEASVDQQLVFAVKKWHVQLIKMMNWTSFSMLMMYVANLLNVILHKNLRKIFVGNSALIILVVPTTLGKGFNLIFIFNK